MNFDGTDKKVNYDIHGRTKAKKIAKLSSDPPQKVHTGCLLHEMTNPSSQLTLHHQMALPMSSNFSL